MTDELLDLVNEKDEIIGEVWKSKANQDPKLIHREVGIAILDKNKRVLFQKRSVTKKVMPNYWTISAAGHILKGELPEVAARRELQEELGFNTTLEYLHKTLVKRSSETHFAYLFSGQMPMGAKVTLQKDEVGDTKFFSKKELIDLGKTENVEPVSMSVAMRLLS